MKDTTTTALRLLWLTENYFPSRGGMAQSCDRIVYALRRQGVWIDVAHLSSRAQTMKVETRLQGRDMICPLGNDPAHAINCLWNVVAQEAQRYTHVIAFGGTLPLVAAPVFASWLGVRLITLIRGNDFDTAIFSPKRADVVRHALEKSARVCVISRDKAQKIRALFPHLQPLWIPNGIDINEWSALPSTQERAQQWRREKVSAGRRVLGMFGHIKPKKGGLFFLETLLHSGLAERFHLLFVGELDAAIVDWLTLHQAEIAHHSFPFVERYELPVQYLACDFAIIASFYDGLPNVLLEAAGLGVAVLAAKAGGMADVLVDTEHGFLFYPGDAHECRKALERAAAVSDAVLQAMGENARRLVASRLTLEAETAGYLDVLMDTLCDGQTGRGERDAEALVGERMSGNR